MDVFITPIAFGKVSFSYLNSFMHIVCLSTR